MYNINIFTLDLCSLFLVKSDCWNCDELKRHRIGEGGMELDDLSFQQLRSLEEDMNSSIAKIRERKVKSILPILYGSSNSLIFFTLST